MTITTGYAIVPDEEIKRLTDENRRLRERIGGAELSIKELTVAIGSLCKLVARQATTKVSIKETLAVMEKIAKRLELPDDCR